MKAYGASIEQPDPWTGSLPGFAALDPRAQGGDAEAIIDWIESCLADMGRGGPAPLDQLPHAPVLDEEQRLFARLGEARYALSKAVRQNRGLLLTLMRRADVGDSAPAPEIEDPSDEEFDDDSGADSEPPSGMQELAAFLGEAGDEAAQKADAPVPYSTLARLIENTEPADLEAASRISAALARFRRARDRVAASFLPLVPRAVYFYRHGGVPFEDLVQEGNIGLLKAIERFDPARGSRFQTYAVWWIRQSVTRAVDDQCRTVRIPVHRSVHLRAMERAQSSFRAQHGREPDPAELAERAEVPLDLVKRMERALLHRLTLAQCRGHLGELLVLVPTDEGHPVRSSETHALRREMARCLMSLEPKQERIIRARFGLAGDDDKTLQEVGDSLGVTRERIRQIEAQAIKTLRRSAALRRLRAFIDA